MLWTFLQGCSPYFHSVKSDLPDNNNDNNAEQLASFIKNDYPFTRHKNIEWDNFSSELYSFLPESGPSEQDYLNMRELIYNIPDARLNISSKNDRSLKALETSGSLGFEIAFSPPDQYYVSRIDSQGEAWKKGIRVGNSIIGWNQTLISEAITSFPLRWGYHPASPEMERLLACHFLTKGKPGSSSAFAGGPDQAVQDSDRRCIEADDRLFDSGIS